jgi:hypothetical protein
MCPELEADRLTTICEQIVQTMWDFQHLKTLQPTTACYGMEVRISQETHLLAYTARYRG